MTIDNPNAIPKKHFGYKKIAKPKHAEELSTAESLQFTPWRVDLQVEVSADEPEPVTYAIYLRAPSPHKAQWLAYGAFMSWEHHKYGIPDDQWPMVSEKVNTPLYKLTEQEYMEMWKEAQRHPCMHAGIDTNPYIFRFMDDKWYDVLKARKRRSIIVPDKAGWASVAKRKAEIDAKLRKG